MGTFHPHAHALHGITCVALGRGATTWVGRVDTVEDGLVILLDVDGVLWFLALDVALVNMDGYWVRASDFSILRDKKGKFKDIQSYKRAHGADIKRSAKKEAPRKKKTARKKK